MRRKNWKRFVALFLSMTMTIPQLGAVNAAEQLNNEFEILDSSKEYEDSDFEDTFDSSEEVQDIDDVRSEEDYIQDDEYDGEIIEDVEEDAIPNDEDVYIENTEEAVTEGSDEDLFAQFEDNDSLIEAGEDFEIEVSRAEWMDYLANQFEMTIEESEYPLDYFADLDENNEYYYSVLLCAEFGVIATKFHGKVYPTMPATREFVTNTLCYCLGIQKTEVNYSFADYEKLESPEYAQFAIDQEWFELISGKFAPDQPITIKEKNNINISVDKITSMSEIDETHDDSYEFADDVVRFDTLYTAWMDEEGRVVIDAPDIAIEKGQKFSVLLNEIPVVYTAWKILYEESRTVIEVRHVENADAFKEIDIQGSADGSALIVEQIDGIETMVYEEEIFEDEQLQAASTPIISTSFETKKKLSINHLSAEVDNKLSNVKVEYNLSKDSQSFKLSYDLTHKLKIVGKVDSSTTIIKEIPIFKATFAGLVGFDVLLDAELKGELSLNHSSKNNQIEVAFIKGVPRISKDFTAKEFSFTAQVSGKVGIKARLGFLNETLPWSGYIYAEVGGKAAAKIDVYKDGWNCIDLNAWMYGEVGVNVNVPSFIYSKKTYSYAFEFWTEKNSPLRASAHYDNGKKVPMCTRGSGSSSGGGSGSSGSSSSGGSTPISTTISSPSSYSVPCHNPLGYLDVAEGGNGTLHISGWAFDYDNLAAPLQIHVYVGGSFRDTSNLVFTSGSDVIANKQRSDVPEVFNNSSIGNYHGFDYTFNVGFTGTYPVYVYAINVGSYDNANYNTLLTNSPAMVTVKSAKQTCQTPSISISDISGGKKVNITAGSNETVYYKIQKDGKEILNSSCYGSYETHLSSEGNYKISAYAGRSGYNNSGWINRETNINKVISPSFEENAASNGVLLTLGSTTEAAKIYYTIDGTLPTVNSSLYTGAIIIDTETTVKAVAIKSGFVDSEVSTHKVKPDVPTAPTGLKVVGDARIAQGESVTVCWTGNAMSLKYTATLYKDNEVVDISTVDGTTTSFTLSGTGKYEIKVYATNFVGNSEECPDTAIVEAMAPLSVQFIDWDDSIINEQTIPYGHGANVPADPERKGYTFVSWTNISSVENVTNDLVLRAIYKINTYSVKFFNPSGVQVGATQKIEFGSSARSPELELTDIPTGYIFGGWRVIYASADSECDYRFVDSDMNLQAVYIWGNNDLPIVASITSANRNPETGNYNVAVSLTNFPEGSTTALLRVSLLTKGGKMVKSGKAEVEVMADGTATKEMTLKYSGVATVATAVILGLNGDDKTGSAYSKEVRANITTLTDMVWTDWSDWSETKPAKTETNEIEEKVQYQYSDKATTESTASSMTGWTPAGSYKVYGNYGGWSVWYAGNKPNDTETRHYEGATVYPYYYFYCTNCGRGARYPYWGSGVRCEICGLTGRIENTGTVDWFTTPWSNSTQWGSSSKYYQYIYDYRVNANAIYWNWTDGNASAGYRYQDRSVTTYYKYEKWSGWSGWSDEPISSSNTRKVNTRTVYRSREKVPVYSELAGTEDEGGTTYLSEGRLDVDLDLNGKLATIMVYKGRNTDPNEDQLQYVGQTVIGEDNQYSFEIWPKQEPTYLSGDYTICLGVEGSTGLVNIGLIPAPKPTYNVTYMDDDGTILSVQEVVEGENAELPESPKKEGYRFLGWNANALNVQDNMSITAQYTPIEYTIVFVDSTNGNVKYDTYYYGDEIIEPEQPIAEGRRFIGWDYLLEGNTVVTSSKAIFAVYESNTYTVKFLDEAGEVVSLQQVPYGESAVPPETIEVQDKEFLGWSTSDCWWRVTSDVEVKPLLSFLETTGMPTYDVVELGDSVAIYLESATENASIYYSLGEDVPDSTCDLYCESPVIVPLYLMDVTQKEEGNDIELDYSVKVNAIAYSDGKNDSEIQTINCNVKRVYHSTQTFTVAFDPNGGVLETSEVLEDAGLYILYEGQEIGGFPNVTREGYTLVGWFTSDSGGTQVSEETEITENTTLYAQWIECVDHGNHNIIKKAVDATCTHEGYSGDIYCELCLGLIEKGSVIPMIPHLWDDGIITKVATSTEDGIRTYTCTVCGQKKTEKIPKAKATHPAEKITITKKPTIKKPAATKNKVTVKWKHFKRTSKKTKKIWKSIKKVQIQCATDSGFKNIIKTTMVGKSKTKTTIKGLMKKTTYYVRVRYYDGAGYSAWSKVKKVKTK